MTQTKTRTPRPTLPTPTQYASATTGLIHLFLDDGSRPLCGYAFERRRPDPTAILSTCGTCMSYYDAVLYNHERDLAAWKAGRDDG